MKIPLEDCPLYIDEPRDEIKETDRIKAILKTLLCRYRLERGH